MVQQWSELRNENLLPRRPFPEHEVVRARVAEQDVEDKTLQLSVYQGPQHTQAIFTTRDTTLQHSKENTGLCLRPGSSIF